MYRPNIAELYSIYKPKKKKKQLLKNLKVNSKKKENTSNLSMSKLSVKPLISPNDSFQRSKSVFKGKEDNTRYEVKSVEPITLPPIQEKYLEIYSKKSDNNFLGFSPTFDEDFQRLESLVNKNHSARSNLLTVQQRIMDLGVKNLIKSKKYTNFENISFEDIDSSLRERAITNILKTINEERSSSPSKHVLKFPPL